MPDGPGRDVAATMLIAFGLVVAMFFAGVVLFDTVRLRKLVGQFARKPKGPVES